MKDGQVYLRRISEIGGRDAAGNLNRDGKELTKFLKSEIEKAQGGTEGQDKRESQKMVIGEEGG